MTIGLESERRPGLSPGARGDATPLIALATPSIGYGGAEAVHVALGSEFLKRGYRVDFVTGWDEAASGLFMPQGSRHINFRVKRTREAVKPLIGYFRSERPDVMIASLWPFSAACVLARHFAGSRARLAVLEHNMLSIQYQKCGSALRAFLRGSIAYECRCSDVRIGVSGGVAHDLATLSGMPDAAFSVVHNPLRDRPVRKTSEDDAEAIWGGFHGPRILTVGVMKSQKNHAMLVKAFAGLLRDRDARLLILGDGALAEATAALVHSLGLTDKVILPGAVPDPEPYYRSADLFALTSDYEGFGNVIVEALACGLPVVSTDCQSGPSEILEYGRYGRLAPVGDIEAFTRAMLASLDATHDKEALKRRAQDFTPERIADQYLQLLFAK